MIFSFHHLRIDYPSGNKWEIQPFRFHDLKKNLFTWQREMEKGGGWNALFWYNHDQPRIVSRIGDEGKYRVKSAKMLATTIHGLEGTPYIYQGEEIGMTNAGFTDISQYRDIETLNYFNILKQEGKSEAEVYEILRRKSRDNSRTPMQWDDSANAGFTTGTPWIKVNPNYLMINAKQAMEDPDSIFYYYQKLIRLRKEQEIIVEGVFKGLLNDDENIYAYQRTLGDQKLIVACNFSAKEVACDLFEQQNGEELISNYRFHKDGVLKPYEARVVLYEI